jgi:hypothetical protein
MYMIEVVCNNVIDVLIKVERCFMDQTQTFAYVGEWLF